jgi:hypothetical protein
MPKKSASARGTAQRMKPKTAKNFELVRPTQDGTQLADREQSVADPIAVSTTTTTTSPSLSAESPAPVTNMSAAGRLAARRQSSQQRQQRNISTLITAEHYSYVRKDLIYIAILAVIMLAIIIVIYFVLGVNA